MRVVNEAVPAEQLRTRVRAIADSLLEKNPQTIKAAKDAIKRVSEMTVDASEDYLVVRQEALNYLDKSEGRKQGIKQFIDDKSFRPGLGAYKKS
jgi:trans-feruloyl-CoA hydratase/vanillin synthase